MSPTLLDLSRNWDLFREHYDGLSFQDLKTLYGIWNEKYPRQQYFDRNFFLSCIKAVIDALGRENIKVVELGGHKGELAFEVLKAYPKIRWLNFEIIKYICVSGLEKHDYRDHVLSKHLWDEAPDIGGYDAFVSSDTLEHISDKELVKLYNYLLHNKVKYLIVQTPITPNGQTWPNYGGAHVLKMGGNQLKKIFGGSYLLIREEGEWRSFWVRHP